MQREDEDAREIRRIRGNMDLLRREQENVDDRLGVMSEALTKLQRDKDEIHQAILLLDKKLERLMGKKGRDM